MKNKNAHIEDFLNYYLNLDSSPDYAVLIRGNWGSGKSWYIRNYIENSKKEDKKLDFLYVSLYGVTSFNDIEDSFYEQMHPVLASKGMKIAGKIFKGLLKATIHVDLNSDNKSEGSFRPDFPDVNLPDYLNNVDKKILVFDDLERCSLEVSDILGYINQFVENNGSKVIIIANEEEIEKNSTLKDAQSGSKTSYNIIKEKLIGRSFTIVPDYDVAFLSFLKLLKDSKAKNIIEAKSNLLKDLFTRSSYQNLRHLKQAIFDFGRFFALLPDAAIKKNDLIEHIFSMFIAIFFEIKSGNLTENEISNLFQLNLLFEEKHKNESKPKKIASKYGIDNFHLPPINGYLWAEFFKYGTIEKEILSQAILSSNYFRDENTPDWQKLWRYIDLEDSEFKELFESVRLEFVNISINNQYIVAHIVGMFLDLSKAGFIEMSKEEIIEFGRKNIENLKNLKKLYVDERAKYFPQASFGLQYHGKDFPEFIEFFSYLNDEIVKSKFDNYPLLADRLLELMNSSCEKFGEQIIISNSKNNFYYDVPILKYVEVSKFIDGVMKLTNKDRLSLSYIFEKRYSHINVTTQLVDEVSWLIEILNKLKEKSNEIINGPLLKLSLDNYLIPVIESSIEIIKNKDETT